MEQLEVLTCVVRNGQFVFTSYPSTATLRSPSITCRIEVWRSGTQVETGEACGVGTHDHQNVFRGFQALSGQNSQILRAANFQEGDVLRFTLSKVHVLAIAGGRIHEEIAWDTRKHS